MSDPRPQQAFNMFDVRGRASRAELGVVLVVWMATVFAQPSLAMANRPLAFALGLAASIALLLTGVRRLHDRDQSGWWVLLSLVPLVGLLFLVWLAASPADARTNRFGEPARFPGRPAQE